jgi:hypothetical protein
VEPRRLAIRLLVPGGLALSALLNLWIEPPAGQLPSIALGSEALLVVERTAAFFVAWMLALVILAESSRGRLPREISNRGVRYADVPTSQASTHEARSLLRRFEKELAGQRDDIADLQYCINTAKPRRSPDASREQRQAEAD